MSVRLATYGTWGFRRQKQLLLASASAVGGFDAAFAHGPRDVDRGFRWRHRDVLSARRGAGYWLWKPYLIREHLRAMRAGDWFFYCDASAVLLEAVTSLVDHAREENLDFLVFELEPYRLESIWTKRDAFAILGMDEARFWGSTQRLAGCSLWSPSDVSFTVVEEWLEACCDRRLVSDDANTCGLPNLPGFRDHRHDQSLLSLVTKRHGLPAWRDPSWGGNSWRHRYPNCAYPQIVDWRRRTENRLIRHAKYRARTLLRG